MRAGAVGPGGAVPRLTTLWCPDWPATAVGPLDEPIVVLHAHRVVARTPPAAAAGVRIGQRRREAQRCCPEAAVVDHDPSLDGRAFEPVVRAVAELVPLLDVHEPGWVSFASRGPARYFGGEEAFARRLVDTVAELLGDDGAVGDVPVGVGTADGRAASSMAARLGAARGDPVVVDPGGSPAFLAPRRIGWLGALGEADDDLVELLVRLGIRTLGDLARLDPGDVLGRFGPAGRHVHRLAGGLDARPPDTAAPPPEVAATRSFDDPVEQLGPLIFVGKQLADEVVATLSAQGRVCTRLVVTAETDHGERTERAWYRDRGLSAAAMVERVRWQLDAWMSQPGGASAGVVLLRLAPAEVRGDDGHQLGFWGGRSQADHDALRAITRLTALAGDEAVRVATWRGGRLAGERYELVPASSVDLDDHAGRSAPGDGAPWPGALHAPAPATVLGEPVPTSLVDAGGTELRVSGRGEVDGEPAALTVGGRRLPVRAWAGPWPVDQRWWEPERHRRLARFQVVVDDGRAFQVACEQRSWWILAAYD